MRARWVKEVPILRSGSIGHTIVASWWPWKFYLVMTMDLRSDAALFAAANAVARSVGEPERPNCVTGVFRCDALGGSKGEALYEREYATQGEAERGHREIVGLLAAGGWRAWSLRLRRG
jgi:hypothetical protein